MSPDQIRALATFQASTLLDTAGRADVVCEIARFDADLSPMLFLVRAHQEVGRHDEALAIVRGLIDVLPDQPVGWLALAPLALEAGRRDEALQAFLRAGATDPQKAAYEMYEAFPVEATTLLEKAAWNGNDDELWGWLGRLYLTAGRDADALIAIRKAIALAPNDSRWQRLLARMDPAGELPRLEAMTHENPTNDEAWGELGQAYERLGRTGEALVAYRKAVAIDPEWPKALLDLDPAATLLLVQARAEQTNDDEAWGDLAEAYLKIGRTDDALAAFRKAAALDPSDEEWPKMIAKLGGESGPVSK